MLRRPALLAPTLAAVAAGTACAGAPHATPVGGAVSLGTPDAAGWRDAGGGTRLYSTRTFRDFALDVDWRADSANADAGIVLRAQRDDASGGYEIRIAPEPPRQLAADAKQSAWSGPSRERWARSTGAVSGYAASWHPSAARPVGEWNHYRIEVTGQRYRVWLNGEPVNDFFGAGARDGYVGVRTSPGVAWRALRVTPLAAPDAPQRVVDLLRVAEPRAPVRVLVVTATHGFRHTEAIDASTEMLAALQPLTEFRFTFTNDAADITAERLASFDVLFLDNATLRMAPTNPRDSASVAATKGGTAAGALSPEQRNAIRDFVRAGHGLASAHSGVDALYGWPDYRDMVGGGLFREHPWTQPVQVNVEDTASAIVRHFGPRVWLRDEIYVVDTNPRPRSHVLLSLDMPSTGPNARAEDHPLAWTRRYGEGRVFVTVLGHFGDDWRRADYLTHVLQGLRYAAGRLPESH